MERQGEVNHLEDALSGRDSTALCCGGGDLPLTAPRRKGGVMVELPNEKMIVEEMLGVNPLSTRSTIGQS